MTFYRCFNENYQKNIEKKLLNTTKINIKADIFEYEGKYDQNKYMEWYLNFADQQLFGFYNSGLYAQDEIQCSEHPLLAHIREYAIDQSQHKENIVPLTHQNGEPTPILIIGAHRLGTIFSIKNNNPQIYYGNNFCAIHTAKSIDQVLQIFDQGSQHVTNIIAMAAQGYKSGEYTFQQISFTLKTAYIAFKKAVEFSENKKCIIHTGNWGTGAFGNNLKLMFYIQILAGNLAGVDVLEYHSFSVEIQEQCQSFLYDYNKDIVPELEKNKIDIDDIIILLEKLKFKWGKSDGN
ncbi:tyrosyl-tRNA synthetase, putative [Ichthyophthirius multifiliis]|uniref:Tyrosyl-tRNA synthetase, putative n=1 Tax=Ichthyophthirius multifiliis TaxID=5932 RepID=G0QQB5_ICHMU|nr:tyrosyl-tRNA synthetase, putative [Ichthyophthirius multifiliis]EGR32616.1 tyrosyl-tRNA synthetase, putative [Ichthyophthirius multifiliis]|eukprot:XP_004036602.1 tyrosyl-tRNA synthetase, putative [Ichthyophthirius multifiliis]